MVEIVHMHSPGALREQLKCQVCGEVCGSSNTSVSIAVGGTAKTYPVVCMKCASDVQKIADNLSSLLVFVAAENESAVEKSEDEVEVPVQATTAGETKSKRTAKKTAKKAKAE